MIKKRSLVVLILLQIVTLNIYGLYWIHCLARDVNLMCKEDGKKTAGLLAVFFLTPLTLGIYGLVWLYKLGNRLRDNGDRFGIRIHEGGSTVLLWSLFGVMIIIGPLVGTHIIIKNTNALADVYNRKNTPALAQAPETVGVAS